MQFRAQVRRIARDGQRLARKGQRHVAAALDHARVSERGLLPGLQAVDERDPPAAPLELQRGGNPDDTRTEDDDIETFRQGGLRVACAGEGFPV